jgi:hypothetical protein
MDAKENTRATINEFLQPNELPFESADVSSIYWFSIAFSETCRKTNYGFDTKLQAV